MFSSTRAPLAVVTPLNAQRRIQKSFKILSWRPSACAASDAVSVAVFQRAPSSMVDRRSVPGTAVRSAPSSWCFAVCLWTLTLSPDLHAKRHRLINLNVQLTWYISLTNCRPNIYPVIVAGLPADGTERPQKLFRQQDSYFYVRFNLFGGFLWHWTFYLVGYTVIHNYRHPCFHRHNKRGIT